MLKLYAQLLASLKEVQETMTFPTTHYTQGQPSHFIDIQGTAIAYQQSGQGRPLLCVHGNFASKRWFHEQLQAPPPGWRVIALDLPNFAESGSMPEAISIAAYAHYLRAFVDSLELDNIVLLGHSLGGAVAQVYAAQHAESLQGLILLASAGPQGIKTPEERYAMLTMLHNNRQLMSQVLGPTMGSRQPAYFDALVDDALAMHATCLRGNARALEHYDVSRASARLNCPVWVLRGNLDYLISENIARQTAASFPHARLEQWHDVGHSPQIEAPERFNRALAAFLETL